MANFSNKKLCPQPKCGKILEVVSEKIAGAFNIKTLACGHKIVEKREYTVKSQTKDEVAGIYDFKFGEHEDLTLMPFQKEGVQFLERNKFRGLIADDPGLGKTYQFLAPLRMHPKEVLPALIVCKAGLRSQIGKEVFRMTDIPPQVMYHSYEKPQIFKKAIVVVSYDSIWRMKWDESIWSKFKTIIFDECQALKNASSNRTQKIKEICKKYDYPYRIGASATPIKNRGSEYFQILHLLDSAKFPTESGFLLRWIEQDDKGKWRGVKEYKMEEWKQFTSNLIIRRKKEDVLPDLPPIRRSYRNCDLAEEVEEAYAEQMRGFMKEYADGEVTQMKFLNLLAYITKMRQLVAMSKIPDTIEEIDEVLLGSEEKVVVFVHHIAAAQAIMRKMIERCADAGFDWEPVWLQGGMDNVQRDEVIEAFTNGKSRVMVASQLASGEGVDGLQKVCGHAIMHERQWNPANEEQCEGRFSRIGSVKSSILVKYMIAIGTIDEWLTNLIDEKRVDITATLDHRYVTPDETSLTREMMDIIYREGRERWKLR